jgi:hypothetical protein
MRGSKIAPWITIFAGLLWLYAAIMTDENRKLSIILSIVFLLVGAAQLMVNRERYKEETNAARDEEAG